MANKKQYDISISFSTWQQANECPAKIILRQFYKAKKLKLPRTNFRHLFAGNALHKVTEDYINGKLEMSLIPETTERLVRQAIKTKFAIWHARAEKENVALDAHNQAERLVTLLQENAIAPSTATAEVWASFIEEHEGHRIRFSGRVDIIRNIDGNYEIFDVKSSKKKTTYPEQMLMYFLLLERTKGLRISKGTFLLTAFGEERVVVNNQAEVAKFHKSLVDTALLLLKPDRKEDRKAKAGHYCRWCDFRSVCPAQKAKRQEHTDKLLEAAKAGFTPIIPLRNPTGEGLL